MTGVAHLAFRTGAAIVPVVLYGQENIHRGIVRLRRSKVHVRVAPPFHAPAGEPTARAIQVLTRRVMLEIARLLPVEYRGVYTEAVEADET
jgi:1-acyl-sn-glycerol-3-phosphate acyltransferase